MGGWPVDICGRVRTICTKYTAKPVPAVMMTQGHIMFSRQRAVQSPDCCTELYRAVQSPMTKQHFQFSCLTDGRTVAPAPPLLGPTVEPPWLSILFSLPAIFASLLGCVAPARLATTCCVALARSTLSTSLHLSPPLSLSRPPEVSWLLTMPEKKKVSQTGSCHTEMTLWFQRKLTTVCTICSGPSASHLHYGAVACYSCRAFFRRGIGKSYCCVEGTGDCNIDWTCRRSCQWCRFDKSVSTNQHLQTFSDLNKIFCVQLFFYNFSSDA